MRDLARNVEEGTALAGQVRRKEGADVELIDHEIFESWRAVSAFVPRKVGLANDALTGEWCSELARVRIPFRALAAFAHHKEQVSMAIADARNETPPVPVIVTRQQAGVVAGPVVEVTDHVHRASLRRPDAERRAIGENRGAHRRPAVNVTERSWHR